MVENMYQHYLYVIGKLKDVYKLDVDVEHQNIHTFILDKRPVFKLFFGMFDSKTEYDIVVSFHIELRHHEVIQWYMDIRELHPMILLNDSFIEDSFGHTHLGLEAEAIQYTFRAQEILDTYLRDMEDVAEIQEFVQSKVSGQPFDKEVKLFDSQTQSKVAIMEFEKMKTPIKKEEVH